MVLVGLKQMKALFVFCFRFGGGRGTSVMLVDLVFWYCWRRWPRAVLTEGGRCFVMSLVVRPGQVEKNPALIALIHVVITGQKHIWWYQISRFCFVSNVDIWTLLADVSGCWDACWGVDCPIGRRNNFFLGQ